MKKISLLLFSFLFSIASIAQLYNDLKRDHVWLFGYASGHGFPFGISTLDFNDCQLDVYEGFSAMDFSETNASLCDEEGNLICYTNGIYIANANHEQMENGDGLNPGPQTEPWIDDGLPLPQGTLFLPYPEHDSLLALIHGYRYYGVIRNLYYSIVNINSNDGLGEVLSKNIEIINDTLDYGKITATKHGNGRDWWIVIGDYNSNRFNKILLSPEGIKLVEIQEVGTAVLSGLGQGVFSPDGSKYIKYEGINLATGNFLNIYDFDRCTGLLSNQIQLHIQDSAWSMGVAVSPNSRYVYVSSFVYMYQYDLWSSDIAASKDTVAIYDGYKPDAVPLSTPFYLAQIGPDNKIYINAPNSVNVLHIIHNPNDKGKACNMEQHGIILPGLNAYSMPNFPNYRLGPLDDSPCDTLGLDNLPIAGFRFEQDTLDPLQVAFTSLSWFEPENWKWSFGDSQTSLEENPTHVFPSAGIYNICLTVSNDFGEDTFCKEVEFKVTSIDEIENSDFEVLVFPNPAINNVTLLSSKTFPEKSKWVLFNNLGQVVNSQSLPKGQKNHNFFLEEVPGGIYFYIVFGNLGRLDKGKLIIED